MGNPCSEGCGGAACQLEGNVCVPFAEVGASASACLPYCLAYACMTFDEASCFCTGVLPVVANPGYAFSAATSPLYV